jgi:hypothetical protein
MPHRPISVHGKDIEIKAIERIRAMLGQSV